MTTVGKVRYLIDVQHVPAEKILLITFTRKAAESLSERLGDSVRLMGPADAPVRRIGLCSGGGSGEWTAAAQAGCDAFLSGEIKHHHALAMAESGLVAFECGHFATEFPGVSVLASALQNALCAIECNVRVYVSEAAAYAFPRKK